MCPLRLRDTHHAGAVYPGLYRERFQSPPPVDRERSANRRQSVRAGRGLNCRVITRPTFNCATPRATAITSRFPSTLSPSPSPRPSPCSLWAAWLSSAGETGGSRSCAGRSRGRSVPDLHAAADVAGGESAAVAAEGDANEVTGVSRQRRDKLPRFQIPTQRAVVPHAGETAAVRGESEPADGSGMTNQVEGDLAFSRVPDLQLARSQIVVRFSPGSNGRWPPALQASVRTGWVCRSNVDSAVPVTASQHADGSVATAAGQQPPIGENATASTATCGQGNWPWPMFSCPFKTWSDFPVTASMTRTFPSGPTAATRLASGARVIATTSPPGRRGLGYYQSARREPGSHQKGCRRKTESLVPTVPGVDHRGSPPVLWQSSTRHQRFACARLSQSCRNLVPTFPQRSPPSLLTTAACGGLRSTPDCRPRRAFLHLSYSYAPPCGPALLVTQCQEPT